MEMTTPILAEFLLQAAMYGTGILAVYFIGMQLS
jgi:hypothetical protein